MEALLQVLLATDAFRKAGKRADLLTYLVRHRTDYTPGEEIWVRAFKSNLATYGIGEAMRQRISDLKKTLEETFPGGFLGPRFILRGITGKGWRIFFESGAIRATETFWKPHLDEPRVVIVVINEPLFFRDADRNLVFRCFGVDPERKVLPKTTLQLRRPDMYKEEFEAVQPYLLRGEIAARDVIIQFFSTSILRFCLILAGVGHARCPKANWGMMTSSRSFSPAAMTSLPNCVR